MKDTNDVYGMDCSNPSSMNNYHIQLIPQRFSNEKSRKAITHLPKTHSTIILTSASTLSPSLIKDPLVVPTSPRYILQPKTVSRPYYRPSCKNPALTKRVIIPILFKAHISLRGCCTYNPLSGARYALNPALLSATEDLRRGRSSSSAGGEPSLCLLQLG